MIQGEYKIKIWKEDDVYIAKCTFGGLSHHTFGETEEEIFEMIADLFLTLHEIKISKWSKFWHKVLRIN